MSRRERHLHQIGMKYIVIIMEPTPQNVKMVDARMLLWVMILAGMVAVSGMRI